ncbi:unnamed protein product, partial [Owenia fusiformis]
SFELEIPYFEDYRSNPFYINPIHLLSIVFGPPLASTFIKSRYLKTSEYFYVKVCCSKVILFSFFLTCVLLYYCSSPGILKSEYLKPTYLLNGSGNLSPIFHTQQLGITTRDPAPSFPHSKRTNCMYAACLNPFLTSLSMSLGS